MCTVLLPPGVNQLQLTNISYHIIYYNSSVTQKMEAAWFYFFLEMSYVVFFCENLTLLIDL